MQIQIDSSQKEVKEHGNHEFPFLVSYEKLSNYESGSFMWHWHKEIELTLITEGEMIYQINNRSFHLKKGQALFGNSGTLHTGSMYVGANNKSTRISIEDHDCEYTSITFDPQLIYGNENSIIYTKYMKQILQDMICPAICFDLSCDWHYDIIGILCEIIVLNTEKPPAYEIDIISKLLDFWKLLSLHYHFENADIPNLQNYHGQSQYDRIRQIVLFIEKNYDSDLTLDDIAEYVHLSRSACSRLFKKHMNLSLFEYINQYRIEKSIELLNTGQYSITEISKLVGYNDSNYFSKLFHKYKGCSPRTYLKSN